jgi:transposase
VEITEVIRQWQAGRGIHEITRSTGLARNTIRKYLLTAQSGGLVRDGPPPTESQLIILVQLNRAGPRQVVMPTNEVLEPWADQIQQWLKQDKLKLTRVQELLAQHRCLLPYMSLRRFVIRRGWLGKSSQTTVRMADTAPGEVAEADFGRLGLMWDPQSGRRRQAWGLITVLGYSRHEFLWPLFGQQLSDVIQGLEATWAFFGGLPRYLVLDNFPAAVVGTDPLNPRLTRGFLEYAQHRGFIADPARPGHAKDKAYASDYTS